MKIQRFTLAILGLTCGGGGALTIERALRKVPGVMRVYLNPATEMAYVEYDADRVNLREIAQVIEDLGFRVGESSMR